MSVKTDSVQRFVEERERSKTLQFQRQIEEAERMLKQNNTYYSDIIQRLESQGNIIQDTAKRIKEGYVNICSLMQKEHARLLQNHKNLLSKEFKKFRSDFEKYRLTVSKNPSVSLADVEQKIKDFDVGVQGMPQLSNFTYIETADPFNDLSNAFGKLHSGRKHNPPEKGLATRSNVSCIQARSVHIQPDRTDVTTQTEDGYWKIEDSSHTEELHREEQKTHDDGSNVSSSSDPKQQLLKQETEKATTRLHLEVVAQFKHSSALTVLRAISDAVWIAFDRSNKVTSVDQTGRILRSVIARDRVEDICISRTTGRLWVAATDNSIVEYLDNGAIGIVLTLSSRPKCMCITPDNHIVVGKIEDRGHGGGNICVYNTNGVKVNNIHGPLVKPLQMTSHSHSSRRTDIAVVHGGNDARHCVTVYNKEMETQYTYRGKNEAVPFRRTWFPL